MTGPQYTEPPDETRAVLITNGWSSVELRPGDRYTIEGAYQRRTLWQWLTRQPRQLQVLTLGADARTR